MLEVREGYSIALPHIHTSKSDGMVSPREAVNAMAELQDRLGRHIIGGITDHDTIKGLSEANKAAASCGIRLFAGQEVSIGPWPSKHMLALFPEEPQRPIKKGLSAEATIDSIKDNGGLVIPAHPGAFWGIASLTSKEILNLGNRELIDGLEVINGNFDRRNQLEPLAQELNKASPVAQIAGPDSHYGKKDLMTAYTLFPGKTVSDFFKAVNEGTTIPEKGDKDSVSFIERALQFGYSNGVLNVRRYILNNL